MQTNKRKCYYIETETDCELFISPNSENECKNQFPSNGCENALKEQEVVILQRNWHQNPIKRLFIFEKKYQLTLSGKKISFICFYLKSSELLSSDEMQEVMNWFFFVKFIVDKKKKHVMLHITHSYLYLRKKNIWKATV